MKVRTHNKLVDILPEMLSNITSVNEGLLALDTALTLFENKDMSKKDLITALHGAKVKIANSMVLSSVHFELIRSEVNQEYIKTKQEQK